MFYSVGIHPFIVPDEKYLKKTLDKIFLFCIFASLKRNKNKLKRK